MLFLSMTATKDRIVHALYLHHRFMVYGIVCLGACVSLWAVYAFLFASPPIIATQEEVKDVSVKKENIDHVLLWGKNKQGQGASIVVPSAVFAIPTPPVVP